MALCGLYVTASHAEDYSGFCSVETPGNRATISGCTVRIEQATSYEGGTTYRVKIDSGSLFVIRTSKVGACTIRGSLPCLFQPATDGNLAIVDSSGARLEFPAPPSAE